MILTKFLFHFLDSRNEQIDDYAYNSASIQNNQLDYLITKASGTKWGTIHKYASITDYNDFAREVPLQTYDSLKPYIDEAISGKSDILWHGKVKWFAKSSGTTNDKSKFIPITNDALQDCHYKAAKDTTALYSRINPDSSLLSGKSLILGGSHELKNENAHTYSGDLSAILLQNTPDYFNLIRVPDKKIILMHEWEAKLKAIIETTRNADVRSLAGAPSWMMVMIKAMLEATNKTYLTEVWPNLEVFFHGGISFIPYREQYKSIIPSDKMHYMETYNASEGFFAIQNDLSDPAMLLMLDLGIFYEFIPMDKFDGTNSQAIPLEEVELNKNYALVISTNTGLWRYIIGDTVKFLSKDPYKIIITGRTKHYINAFGEELMVDNADRALNNVCAKYDVKVIDYTAAPVFMSENSKGKHQWIIEFDHNPSDLNSFITDFDQALKEQNSDYEAKRYKDITLDRPEVIIARPNLFHDWMAFKGKLGGQNKVPRLCNDRKIIDEIIEFQK
ncbi:MAG: GH3 auxin-responsive promoter family protein [Bacteroidales bacterium]